MFVIWHDKDYDFARWVYLNSVLSKIPEKTMLHDIPKNNSKNVLLKSLKNQFDFQILPYIKYETPDIILQHIDEKNQTSKIVLVTEFMTHTPQHHHPLQRFSRIYGACELKTPVALVLPKSKIKLERKDGIYKPTKYKTNPLIYHIFLKSTFIYKNQTLLFFWPDFNGYLKCDAQHPTAPYIDNQIKRWLYLLNLCVNNQNINYLDDSEIKNQIQEMKINSDYKERNYEDFLKICDTLYKLETISFKDTTTLIDELNLDRKKLSDRFQKNNTTLIFGPHGLNAPSTPFRTDPYAGMLCAFDNLFCRNDSGQRAMNIVLRANNIQYSEISSTTFEEIDHDADNCPFLHIDKCSTLSAEQINTHFGKCPYTHTKQRRIYGEVADVIIFDDFTYYGRGV